MAFLRTILIILLVYYLFKILARLFAPKILSYAARKTEERFRENFGAGQQAFNKEEHMGDVIIDHKNVKKRTTSKKVGEYIDYEELD